MKQTSNDYRLLAGLFFRLLPYQIPLIIINAVNGIVDSLYASNAIGTAAMSAIGLYSPLNASSTQRASCLSAAPRPCTAAIWP